MPPTLRPARPLGRTGVRVPVIGYGTAPLGHRGVSREQAVRCLNEAIDRGITYLDTSPDYGSEEHVGAVMRGRRDEVFLATKVNRRSRDGVLAELKESLGRLQTDHVDLIQIHAVNAMADLEQALAEDGALRGLEDARAQGLTRFVGITGHARPALLAHALTERRFDTVLVALGVCDRLVSSPETFLLPVAREHEVGVIAMKVLGHGQVTNRGLALRYSLGLPGVALAIVGMKAVEEIEQNVEVAADVRPLEKAELDLLIDEARSLVERDARESQKGQSRLFWLHDTKVTGWESKDEPSGVAY
jgi:aryl-alcohol dehydrogenase-like predicted oxidoreductase